MASLSSDSGGTKPLFAAILLLAGLGLAGYGAYDYWQQSQSLEDTVEVDATITETHLEEINSRRGHDYEPVVRFQYTYQNTSYTSNRIFPTTSRVNYDTRSKAQSVLQDYQQGDSVTAYVNPSSPGNAFLKNQKSSYPLEMAGIGALITIITIGSLVQSKLDR